MVCVCTVQTGLFYLRRAAEACSSSSQRGLFTYPLSGPASPPPSPFFPPLRIKWLFVLPQRCLSLASPPLSSLSSSSSSQGMKGDFFWRGGDRSCQSWTDPEGVWFISCLSVSENKGVLCKIPSLSFLRGGGGRSV